MFDFNLTVLSSAIAALIFFASGLSVLIAWRRQRMPYLKSFAIFFIAFAFQLLFISLATGLFSIGSRIDIWFWLIGHMFMFIGVSYFVRFAVQIRFPYLGLTRIVFGLILFFSLISLIILSLNVSKMDCYFTEQGIHKFRVPLVSSITIGVFTAVSFLSSFVLLISGILTVKSRFVKIRSLIFVLGFLMLAIGGPMYNFIETLFWYFLANGLLVAGSIMMLLGIYLRKFLKVKQI